MSFFLLVLTVFLLGLGVLPLFSYARGAAFKARHAGLYGAAATHSAAFRASFLSMLVLDIPWLFFLTWIALLVLFSWLVNKFADLECLRAAHASFFRAYTAALTNTGSGVAKCFSAAAGRLRADTELLAHAQACCETKQEQPQPSCAAGAPAPAALALEDIRVGQQVLYKRRRAGNEELLRAEVLRVHPRILPSGTTYDVDIRVQDQDAEVNTVLERLFAPGG
jgi:hypothetical protein